MSPALVAVLLGAVRVHVSSASSCGDAAAVETRLAARSITIAPNEATDAPVVEIYSAATDAGAEATFALAKPSGTTTRTLTAQTCDEVLDALVFALALSLESSDAPVPEAPRPAPPAPPASPASPAPPAAERPPLPAPPPSTVRWGGAAVFGVMAGVAPSLSTTLAANARVESSAISGWSPSGRAGVVFTLPSTASADDSEVSFAHQAGTLEGCPFRFGTRAIGLRPCARLQVGRIQARSAAFPGARLSNQLWASGALVVEGSVELVAGTYLAAEIAAAMPMTRDAFRLGDVKVFETPILAASAGIGVGVHFP